jgi:hypothetical protein
MMAVLSEALICCPGGEPLLQALSAWLCFVQLLAAHAPKVLESIAAQAAVVLLPVLEPANSRAEAGSMAAAAAAAAEGGAAAAAAAASAAAGQAAAQNAAAVELAAEVMQEMAVKHRVHVRAALKQMPPLPPLAVLKQVNAVLIEVRLISMAVCVCGCVCGCVRAALCWGRAVRASSLPF